MHLLSINVSTLTYLRTIKKNTGKTTKDNNPKKTPTGIYKQPVEGPTFIRTTGIDGDTIIDTDVHGGLDQAVYIYTLDDYLWWEKELDRKLTPGIFGENLTISSLGDIPLTIGDRLHIGNVVLEVTAPRIPCFKLAVRMEDPKFGKKFVNAVRPGVYARVLEEGSVSVGDKVDLIKTTHDYATTNDVFVEWHKKKRLPELLQKALNSPMAAVHKSRFTEWLKP